MRYIQLTRFVKDMNCESNPILEISLDRDNYIELYNCIYPNNENVFTSGEYIRFSSKYNRIKVLMYTENEYDTKYKSYIPIPEEYLMEKKVKVIKCTCGAKHTSFPDRHLDWCDLNKKD